MMRVRSTSPSKKPAQAESMASGGTVDAITIPVLRKSNLSGIMIAMKVAKKGERIKIMKLATMGEMYNLNFKRLFMFMGKIIMKIIRNSRGVMKNLRETTLS